MFHLKLAAFVLICGVVASSGSAHAQEFGYSGRNGPSRWGHLDPAWRTCATGESQSPIDFGRRALLTQRTAQLRVQYGETHGVIFNNGHTIEVETEGENILAAHGVEYRLVQFHFHAPSEHTAEGRGFDMELHLVHRSATGGLAVIGALMRRGASSGALASVFARLPSAIGVREELESAFDPRAFLPRSLANYRYEGSLTTPPCTESVRWIVIAEPITISDEDMARLVRRVRFNARPVQRVMR